MEITDEIKDLIRNSNMEIVQELNDLVGSELTFKILEYFDGERIYIPKIENIYIHERNKKIIYDYYYQDKTIKQLSRIYKLTDVSIRNIINNGINSNNPNKNKVNMRDDSA